MDFDIDSDGPTVINLDLSLKYCTNSIRCNPNWYKSWIKLGYILNDIYKYDKALVALNRGVELSFMSDILKTKINLINRKKLKTYFESKNELAMRGFWETYAWTKFRNTPSYIAELPHKEYLKQLGDTMDHNKVVFPNVKLQTFEQWKEHYKQTYSKVDK